MDCCEHGNETSGSIEYKSFSISWTTISFSRMKLRYAGGYFSK
jgi:hypothetical protein